MSRPKKFLQQDRSGGHVREVIDLFPASQPNRKSALGEPINLASTCLFNSRLACPAVESGAASG